MNAIGPTGTAAAVPLFKGSIFDGDTHLYETPDAFSRYLPEKFKKEWDYHWKVGDDGELIDLALMTEAELDAAAVRGELTDAKTLIGLLWLQNWQSGRWQMTWQTPAQEPVPIMRP